MKTVVPFILLVLELAIAPRPSNAATKTWQGSMVSFVWSDPGNWDPAGIPQDGDDLWFHGNATVSHFGLMINDLTNLVARSLRFTANAIPEIDWTLSGNTLTVTHTIDTTDTDDTEVDINCGIRLGGHARFEAARGPELIGDAALHLNGPINLNGFNLTLVEGPPHLGAADLDVAGPISGVGNIIVDAANASVELKGDEGNTFIGTVTVSGVLYGNEEGAELILNKSSGLAVPGGLLIGTNCVVKLSRPHQIDDAATVVIAPGGQLRLEGHTEAISGLSLREASVPQRVRDLQVDTGGATLSVIDNITALNSHPVVIPTIQGQLGLPSGSHMVHTMGTNAFALKIEAEIVGDGGFTKTGPSGLLLTGNSSFGGDAVLQEGRVEVTHANGLGSPSGATVLDGGQLFLNNVSVGIETLLAERSSAEIPELGAILNVIGLCRWAGPMVLNTNLTVSGGEMTLSGGISGPGGLRFIFNDAIQITGPDPNTYTGDTRSGATLLQLNKPPGVTAFRGRLQAGDGNVAPSEVRWLQDYQCVGADVILGFDGIINLNNHREDFGPLTFNGGAITTGTSGELGVYGLVTVNATTSTATIDGRLGLPPGVHEYRVHNGSALPDLRINATILGAGHLRKTGPGQLWLAASNIYTGVTFVDEGTVSALNPYAFGAATAGTTVSEGATLDLNAITTTMPESLALRGTGDGGMGALNVFGLASLRSTFPSIYPAIDMTTNTTIRVGPGSLLTVDGFISGVGTLTKTGAGTLLMTNANENTYSGDTVIADGTLDLAKPNNVVAIPGNLIVGPAPLNSSVLVRWSQSGQVNASATVTANEGSLLDLNGFNQTVALLNLNDGADVQTGSGTLNFSLGGTVNVGSLSLLGSHAASSIIGNIAPPPNATLTFAVNPYAPTPPFTFGPELYVGATIAAPLESPVVERAGLRKVGGGSVQLLGNNTYRGWTDISEGTLIAAHNGALGFALSGTYVFNTGTLELQGGITTGNETVVLNSTATPALFSWAGDNIWGGMITLQRDSTVGVGAGNEFRVNGVIGGTGHFTKTGLGILVFQGPNHNTYAGETYVNEGPLYLAKPIGVTAVPQALSIGTPAGLSAVVVNYSSYQIIGNIFVNRGGRWNVYGNVENVDHLWLTDGGDVATETGVLAIKTGGSIQVVPGNAMDPATIAGTVEFLAGSHSINVGAGSSPGGVPDLDIGAWLTSAGETITLQKDGPGTARFSANNSYVGATVVNGGVLRIDGFQTQSPVQVNPAGMLQGNGVVGSIAFLGDGGLVAPGASAGVLSCNGFNINSFGSGTLEMELNGTLPGTEGYDQLIVNGLVALSEITLRVRAGFSSPSNHQFVLINNDGGDAVQGTFTGLPENATVTAGDQVFQISYAGGDGNDVVLTKTGDIYRPALTIERVAPASVRLLWPTNDPAFTLQSTTNLNGTNVTDWASVPDAPFVLGTNRVVTNSSSSSWKIYRLFRP